MKTVQALVKQAVEQKEKRKVVAAVADAKEIELEKVPEEELRRPKAAGWVKEDSVKTRAEEEEEKREAFKERVAEKKKEEAKAAGAAETPLEAAKAADTKASAASVPTVKTTRKLPSIPGAGSPAVAKEEVKERVKEETEAVSPAGLSSFCPGCGKDLTWKFCPYCGLELPHD